MLKFFVVSSLTHFNTKTFLHNYFDDLTKLFPNYVFS